MAWAAITEADLLNHISGTELESLRAAALADGQDDPVSPSITQVTNKVRGYVASCAENNLDSDTTKIPDRLMADACAMVIAAIIGRIPGYMLDEDKRTALSNALKLMEKVASCDYAIEDPSSGSDAGGDMEVANNSTRVTTRSSLGGLS